MAIDQQEKLVLCYDIGDMIHQWPQLLRFGPLPERPNACYM